MNQETQLSSYHLIVGLLLTGRAEPWPAICQTHRKPEANIQTSFAMTSEEKISYLRALLQLSWRQNIFTTSLGSLKNSQHLGG